MLRNRLLNPNQFQFTFHFPNPKHKEPSIENFRNTKVYRAKYLFDATPV